MQEMGAKQIEINVDESQKSKESYSCMKKRSSPTDVTKNLRDPFAPAINPVFMIFFCAMLIALYLKH
jgi:hypothetical protein